MYNFINIDKIRMDEIVATNYIQSTHIIQKNFLTCHRHTLFFQSHKAELTLKPISTLGIISYIVIIIPIGNKNN